MRGDSSGAVPVRLTNIIVVDSMHSENGLNLNYFCFLCEIKCLALSSAIQHALYQKKYRKVGNGVPLY